MTSSVRVAIHCKTVALCSFSILGIYICRAIKGCIVWVIVFPKKGPKSGFTDLVKQ